MPRQVVRPPPESFGIRGALRAGRCLVWAAAAVISAGSAVADSDGAYFRGGIGVDWPASTVFTDRDCSSTSPAALYGCGVGGDGAPYRTTGGFDSAALFELGLGYPVAPALRLELLVEYRPLLVFQGRANFLAPEQQQSVSAELSTLSGMLAAHVDLPALGAPKLGPFAPFAGAGVGIVRTRIDRTEMAFPRTTTIVPGASRTGLAWMATAGLATRLSERVTLDLAWRYTDLGEVHTGRGAGQVVWRDGSREPLPLNLDTTRAKLRTHGLRLSLRYAF